MAERYYAPPVPQLFLIAWSCDSRLTVVGTDGKKGATDYDTLAFKLQVKCERNPLAAEGDTDPHEAFIHANGMPRRMGQE